MPYTTWPFYPIIIIKCDEKVDEIKRAKLKALIYLLKTIDQKWNSLIDNHEKLTKYYWEAIDWPIRFEAYSYLANKDENKKKKFAIELRDLWNQWKELSKKDYIGSEEIFWPSIYEVEFDGKLVPCNEIENHISMFRAKEIFGIGGFDEYYKKAKERLKNMLLEKRPYSWYKDFRIIWHIVRSSILRLELSDYLNAAYLKIKESKELNRLLKLEEKNDFGVSQYQAMYVFFLCFSNLGTEPMKLAKKGASNLIDEQENNGSFGSDMLNTCLCASSIHFTNVDPSNSVCSKAINYILTGQDKKGYWNFLFGEGEAWNILSTVVVLETLDFITSDQPLPLWAEKTKPLDGIQKQKSPRVQPVPPFKTPKGINWYDVSIRFISEEVVQLRAGSASEGRDFKKMGFEFRESGKPDLGWRALIELGKHQGIISWDDDIDGRIKRNLKYYIHLFRKRLKYVFELKEDPFKAYNRRTKTWETKFSIKYDIQE